MDTNNNYCQDAILEHLEARLPLNSAPGLAELISHVEAVSTLLIQNSGYHFNSETREEAVSQVKLEAFSKLLAFSRGEAFFYDSQAGAQLATYLSGQAVNRALDVVRRNSGQNRLIRKAGYNSQEAELRYAEAFEEMTFSISPDQNRMVRPLQVLCTQLQDRLDWSDRESLKGDYEQTLQVSLERVQDLWKEARREALQTLQARETNYLRSVTTALMNLPDSGILPVHSVEQSHSNSEDDDSPVGEDFNVGRYLSQGEDSGQRNEGYGSIDSTDSEPIDEEVPEEIELTGQDPAPVETDQQLRGQQRTHDSRKRLLISGAIEYSFFPLQAKAICEIFGLETVSNGQQARSRSRDQFFKLLTTDEEDLAILMSVFNRDSSSESDLFDDDETDLLDDENLTAGSLDDAEDLQ